MVPRNAAKELCNVMPKSKCAYDWVTRQQGHCSWTILWPHYTQAKGPNHVVVRVLDSYLKAIPIVRLTWSTEICIRPTSQRSG